MAEDRDDASKRRTVHALGPSTAAERMAKMHWQDNAPEDGDYVYVAVWVEGEATCYRVEVAMILDFEAGEVDISEGWPE